MNPANRMKIGAVAFSVLWTGWMLWWSGSPDRANFIILAIYGMAVGYTWYRAMRWQSRRTGTPPQTNTGQT